VTRGAVAALLVLGVATVAKGSTTKAGVGVGTRR
jgi:hypothetical protein